jgi:hypothetical protein
MEAALSAIVVTPGSCRQVIPLLRRLRAQTIHNRIEIVFVTTALAHLQPDKELLSHFARWKAVAVGPLTSMAAARAAGVHAATCPYVAFTEEHCFPEPGWAEAILEAFEHHRADAVGPVIENANPALSLSWANLFTEYGLWMAPHPGGLMNHLPGHNSAYRRDRLLAPNEFLVSSLESEFAMHARWHALGRRLWLEPSARVHHVNMTDVWAHLRAACAFQQPWANSRAAEWRLARRLAYAFSWPLIAAVRLPRVVSAIRRAGKGRSLPILLPPIIIGLLASAFGEFLGYLGFLGNANALLLDVELYRERYLSPRDTAGLALFQ